MRLKRLLGAAIFGAAALAIPKASDAQINSWMCSMDAAGNVPQTPPAASARVASQQVGMAPSPSKYEVYLAEGGRTGFFVYAHLYGKHNSRSGGTSYFMGALLQDPTGYVWAVLPQNSYRIKGTSRKPERHGHCSIQWDVPGDLADDLEKQIAKGRTVKVVPMVSRERGDDFDKDVLKDLVDFGKILGQYMSGGVSPAMLLQELNKGKEPPR